MSTMTTSTPSLRDYRPRLRREIVFGPELRKGSKMIHYVKDPYTRQFYRIGQKECFLLQQMDGSRSIAEIETNYRARYGRQLDRSSWEHLFASIGQRQLLEDTMIPEEVERLRERTLQRSKKSRRWLEARFPLTDPCRVLQRMTRVFGFAFGPAFLITAAVCILLMEAWILLHQSALSQQMRVLSQSHWPLFWWVFGGIMLTSAVLHELSHGLACVHYGGEVHEMGIVFRYLCLFPYCEIDDVVLFPNRRHRVYVAFAGTFVSLLLMIPFLPAWWLAEPGTPLKVMCAAVFTIYNVISLINLVPFVQLDGYFMLSQWLGIPELRQESYGFWKTALRQWFRTPNITTGYSIRDQRIYAIYGLMSAIATALILLKAIHGWHKYFVPLFGERLAYVAVLAISLMLFLGERRRVEDPGAVQK
jgi:putative peptide zinc metalloprotease protein